MPKIAIENSAGAWEAVEAEIFEFLDMDAKN
jgi:hypothetical protein